MIKKKLEKFLEEYRKEVYASKSSEIQEEIQILQKRWSKDEIDLLIDSTCKDLIENLEQIETEREAELTIAESLAMFNETAQLIGNNLKFRISVDGLDDQIYRIISLPSFLPLSGLAYAIIASMNAEGDHLYNIKIGSTYYVSDIEDSDYDKASQVHLVEMNLKTGMKMKMIYDYGENYVFNIEYLGEVESNKLIDVYEGKGNGIIEDNKEKLYQVYENAKRGKKLPKKYSAFDAEENTMDVFSRLYDLAEYYGENVDDEFEEWLEEDLPFKGNQA